MSTIEAAGKGTGAIETALKMEKDSIEFYEEAAERTAHPVGKRMFLSIREDERHHLEMLGSILKELDIDAHHMRPRENIKTIFTEMREHLSERVKATADEMEALRTAMEMEKEGLEFYKKSASSAQNPREKALFERLIEEEKEHYAVFSNTYSFLYDTGSWFMWEEHSIVDGGTPWA